MSREQPSIAYLGPKASYAWQAACKLFPESEFYHMPIPNIEDIFQAIQSGKIDRGVVPYQNSSNGMVLEVLDIFANRTSLYPNVYISGEAFLKIDHCLLGFPATSKDLTPPHTPLERGNELAIEAISSTSTLNFQHIKHVYSHSAGLGQCSKFLSKYLPHATRHEVASTAAAAQIAANDPKNESASIGSISVLQDNQLAIKVLAERIQDAPDNTTRFFVLKRVSPIWHYEPGSMEDVLARKTGEKRIISITFVLDQSKPEALADALTIFKSNKLNVRYITSRPTHDAAWDLRYYVELSFVWDEMIGNSLVDKSLKELALVSRERSCLGAWGTTPHW